MIRKSPDDSFEGTELVHDAHATYDLADLSHDVVSRVAEHALGDQLLIAITSDIAFNSIPERAIDD